MSDITDVANVLQSFRDRAEALAQVLPPVSSADSGGTQLIAGGLGQLASDLVRSRGFDSLVPGRTARSAVSKWVRMNAKEQDRQAKAQWLQGQLQKVDNLLREVESFLGGVSVPSNTLTVEGNSIGLVRKLGRVHRLKKPDSKSRALVSVLDEVASLRPIPNDLIPTHLAERSVKTREEAVTLIANLETALRQCVGERLSRASRDWWRARVPPAVRKRAEGRQTREESIYPGVSAPEDPLSYVGFADYDDIILFNGNWEECFRTVFKDRAWLSTKLGELEPIRNSLMHSRRLTQHGVEKLRVNSRDILVRIKRA